VLLLMHLGSFSAFLLLLLDFQCGPPPSPSPRGIATSPLTVRLVGSCNVPPSSTDHSLRCLPHSRSWHTVSPQPRSLKAVRSAKRRCRWSTRSVAFACAGTRSLTAALAALAAVAQRWSLNRLPTMVAASMLLGVTSNATRVLAPLLLADLVSTTNVAPTVQRLSVASIGGRVVGALATGVAMHWGPQAATATQVRPVASSLRGPPPSAPQTGHTRTHREIPQAERATRR
jgi:exosortase/archaeosortase family protein